MSQVPTAFPIKCMKIIKIGLKWVHMAWLGLILRLVRGLWHTIIFKPLLTPKRAFTIQFESYFWIFVTENVSQRGNLLKCFINF